MKWLGDALQTIFHRTDTNLLGPHLKSCKKTSNMCNKCCRFRNDVCMLHISGKGAHPFGYLPSPESQKYSWFLVASRVSILTPGNLITWQGCTKQDKTIQYNTHQCKTRRDKRKQYAIRHDKTRQDTTTEDETDVQTDARTTDKHTRQTDRLTHIQTAKTGK